MSYKYLIAILIFCTISNQLLSNHEIRINEFMTINSNTISDSDGDFSDWIELHNFSNAAIDLGGWSLTDDRNNLKKWLFPNTVIQANSYILIFASGKNKVYENGEIHTNFKLSSEGEYLALSDNKQSIITEFSPTFPVLESDNSFGWHNNQWVVFSMPTPGRENGSSSGIVIPQPEMSHKHGIYSESFVLTINPKYQNAKLYYTLDGSEPSQTSNIYTSPINVSKTTIIRAKSYNNEFEQSKTTTQTYLFVDDIIFQNNTPEGYPQLWGKYTGIAGDAIADYEMDPEIINNPIMKERVINALKALPTLSLTSNKEHFFSHIEDKDKGGIYIFTGAPGNEIGKGWERPASIEYFEPDHSSSFQIDCSVQLHGGHSRRAEKMPKHSFRISFKKDYGPTKLKYPLFKDSNIDSFDHLILRAGFGNTWTHWAGDERSRAQYGRDTWSKDTQLDMGHISSHGIFVHLYINGIYWGIYNAVERLNSDFAASYLGGTDTEYDVIKDYAEVQEGQGDSWDELIKLVNKGVKDDEKYYSIIGKNPDGSFNPNLESLVDEDNLIDYMLLNFYGGNTDWDHHNWVAIRNRVNPGKGFKFFAWDQEHVLKSRGTNVVNEFNKDCPSNVFQKLVENEIFKRRFIDRALLHCTLQGALTPEKNKERWMKRSVIIENAIDAESARWGDYRRDVHPYQSDPFELYTKDEHWLPAREYLLNDYFPDRTEILIDQLRKEGLYPYIDAPYFIVNGEKVIDDIINDGEILELKTSKGKTYYTIDGSDPSEWENDKGTPSSNSSLYNSSITLNNSIKICARTYYTRQWSAMRCMSYINEADYNDLRITEIHYHPLNDSIDGDQYEFIEIKNTGNSTINLNGLYFSKGITYHFDDATTIPPNGFVVLASNAKKFYTRYNIAPTGEYTGKLSNNGEEIELKTPQNITICYIDYSDIGNWPYEANGKGPSIVPIAANPSANQNSPLEWRNSYYKGGSPFSDDEKKTESDLVSFEGKNKIIAFPNPFYHSIVFKSDSENYQWQGIAIFNTMGEKIIELKHSNPTSSLIYWDGKSQYGQNLPAGIYVGKIINNKNYSSNTIKIIKK